MAKIDKSVLAAFPAPVVQAVEMIARCYGALSIIFFHHLCLVDSISSPVLTTDSVLRTLK